MTSVVIKVIMSIFNVLIFIIVPGFSLKESFSKKPVVTIISVILGLVFSYMSFSPLVDYFSKNKTIEEKNENEEIDIIDYFNLYIGSSWLYNVSQGMSEAKSIKYENKTFSYTIKHIEYDYSKRIGRIKIQQKGYNPLDECFSEGIWSDLDSKKSNISKYFWYVIDKSTVYKSCNYDESISIKSNIDNKKLIRNNDAMLYKYPFFLDSTWGLDEDIDINSFPEEEKRWRWHVSKLVNKISTPAGTFNECVEITYATNPEYFRKYLCKKIGLVMDIYHHNGTANEKTVQLIKYSVKKF